MGLAAKLFRDSDTQLLRTYDDKEAKKVWFVFKVNHIMKITPKTLDSLYQNKIKFRIWDSKEKCCPRSRFERPRAFRLSDQVRSNNLQQSEKVYPVMEGDYPYSIPSADVNPAFHKHVQETTNLLIYEQRVPSKAESPEKNLSREYKHMKKENDRVKQELNTPASSKKYSLAEDKRSSEPAAKYANAMAEIDLSVLFSGCKSVTSRGRIHPSQINAKEGVKDVFVTFTIDRDILSDEMKKDLNPLVFRIHEISSLPKTPWSYKQLSQKCKPVYCKYRFCGEEHVTHHKPHSANAHFDDIKVFLAGNMNVSDIVEEFQVSKFNIEVHDRDAKDEDVLSHQETGAKLFGEDPLDLYFGQVKPLDLEQKEDKVKNVTDTYEEGFFL